jgi:RimJ/RimL family protein N-acetyltransferase
MTEPGFIIRPIRPSDKMPLRIGLQELSAESIRQRFFTPKKDFTDKELAFLTEVDQETHIAYIAFYFDGTQELPAGVIRAFKSVDNPLHAEIGIIIIDQYQGKGLGMRLLETLADASVQKGVTHFYGDYLNSNTKMIKLLEKFSLTRGAVSLKHIGEGIIRFFVPLTS